MWEKCSTDWFWVFGVIFWSALCLVRWFSLLTDHQTIPRAAGHVAKSPHIITSLDIKRKQTEISGAIATITKQPATASALAWIWQCKIQFVVKSIGFLCQCRSLYLYWTRVRQTNVTRQSRILIQIAPLTVSEPCAGGRMSWNLCKALTAHSANPCCCAFSSKSCCMDWMNDSSLLEGEKGA